jgi:hypothetical protein
MHLVPIVSAEANAFVHATLINSITTNRRKTMDEIDVTAAKPVARAVERVTLGKEEAEKVSAWLKQLEVSSNGFLVLTRSDVVNFIIRSHSPDLSVRTMQQIRNQNYDPIRHLNWITPRLKDALERGDTELVSAMQTEIRGIEVSFAARAASFSSANADSGLSIKPKVRRRRSQKDGEADQLGAASGTESTTELPIK